MDFLPSQDLTAFNKILIFLISYFSNLFSSLAGGGAGLIQLPSLLLFGIPYYQALAVHKIATVALGVGGSIRNINNLKDNSHIIFQLLLFGIPGVILGASIINYVSEEYLYLVLSIFSILLGIYSLLKPNLGLISIKKKFNLYTIIKFNILTFIIAILNGSISSGTGLLVTILLIKTFGLDFLTSISITFLTVGIFWNAVGAIALSQQGSLPIILLFILIIGSFLGGFSGAHLSNLKGNRLIRKFFTSLCFVIGSTLLLKILNN